MGAGRVHLAQIDLAEQDRFFISGGDDDFSRCIGVKLYPQNSMPAPRSSNSVAISTTPQR